jgi:lysozyme
MKTSQKGIDLIKHFEGLKLKAYLCPANVPTIGYGTTILPNGAKVPIDSICTKEEAEMFLKHDLIAFENQVLKLLKVEVNQNQFDALVSFTYNLGSGCLAKSTLLKNINANLPIVQGMFTAYSNARIKGLLQSLPGLVRRRNAEFNLYVS